MNLPEKFISCHTAKKILENLSQWNGKTPVYVQIDDNPKVLLDHIMDESWNGGQGGECIIFVGKTQSDHEQAVPFKMITREVKTVTEDGVLYTIDPETGEKRKTGPLNGLKCFEVYNQPQAGPGSPQCEERDSEGEK